MNRRRPVGQGVELVPQRAAGVFDEVVDEGQHVLGAAPDGLGMRARPGVALLQQLGVADDRGERARRSWLTRARKSVLVRSAALARSTASCRLLLALGERGDGAAVPGGFEDQREVALDDPAEQGQLAVDGGRVGFSSGRAGIRCRSTPSGHSSGSRGRIIPRATSGLSSQAGSAAALGEQPGPGWRSRVRSRGRSSGVSRSPGGGGAVAVGDQHLQIWLGCTAHDERGRALLPLAVGAPERDSGDIGIRGRGRGPESRSPGGFKNPQGTRETFKAGPGYGSQPLFFENHEPRGTETRGGAPELNRSDPRPWRVAPDAPRRRCPIDRLPG